MTESLAMPSRRKLGRSDIEVAPMAWGMWRFGGDRAQAAHLVETAIDAGFDFFDTADIYGFDGNGGFGDAETLLGEVLKTAPGLRNRIILATKGGIRPPLPYDSSSAYLEAAIDASLRRLGVDCIDLWQIHRPDILTHPAEIAAAVARAISAGKIRTLGVSNMTPTQIATLAQFVEAPIVSTQPELSPLCIAPLVNGETDQAIAMDMAVLAWSPLGGGQIAEPQSAREQSVAAALDAVASEQGVSRAAATYAWIMAHPARITPIVGTQSPERLRDAASALGVKWTRQAWYGVFEAARGEKLP